MRFVSKPFAGRPIGPITFNSPDVSRRYRIELLTPMIGGGVVPLEVDRAMPFRLQEIIPRVRHMWRLLQVPLDASPDWRAIFRGERDIFGAGGENAKARKIKARVIGYPNVSELSELIKNHRSILNFNANPLRLTTEPGRDGTKQIARAPRDAFGFGAFPLAQENQHKLALLIPSSGGNNASSAFWEIEIRVARGSEEALADDFEKALRWWAALDGIGMRCRRGFGKVRIVKLSGNDTREELRITDDELAEQRCLLNRNSRLPGNEYSEDAAIGAWLCALHRMREFRQGQRFARPRRQGVPRPGRSHWPEADTLRRELRRHSPEHAPNLRGPSCFPRAGLGGPIVFKFKDANDPPLSVLYPGNGERYPSPIVLTPWPINNGTTFVARAILLPSRWFGHEWDIGVRLDWNDGSRDLSRSWDHWWCADQRAAQVYLGGRNFERGQSLNPQLDIAAAFLNFF